MPQDFESELMAALKLNRLRWDDPLRPVIQGELFEELVRSDTEICTQETDDAKKLRSVMANPDIYNLEGNKMILSTSNPDYIRTNNDGKIIEAVEAKSGGITVGKIEQISNFLESIKNVISRLKSTFPETLSDRGLGFITRKLNEFQLADNFVVTIAVPYGQFDGDFDRILKKIPEDKLPQARRVLEKCKIKTSPFSKGDLSVMTTAIISRFGLDRNNI